MDQFDLFSTEIRNKLVFMLSKASVMFLKLLFKLSSIHVTDQHEIKFEFLFFRLFVALFVLNLREPELC
jgi:hypothetical protein